jgi:hypothetical protein
MRKVREADESQRDLSNPSCHHHLSTTTDDEDVVVDLGGFYSVGGSRAAGRRRRKLWLGLIQKRRSIGQ